MDGFCRGCLSKYDDPLELLQYNEERRRLFVYSTGLQVKRNDAFTFQLCKECYYSMKTLCKFKKMCRTSDKKIKNYLRLKDDDESMDFTAFLKRNEESFMFRLPILSGASTPANQKTKDDDNESTCTSIQNFMTDILRADEIEDSEARIIREVIEEEADVMEDSLDSHWLEDDAKDEFRLDLSFSRFSTPKSTNRDRMTSSEHKEATSDLTSGEDYDNIPIDISLKKLTDPVNSPYVLRNLEMNIPNDTKKMRCVIDKNLEKALKDENNQEISLQELLASPVFPSKSGASTPTIKQIIFGDKPKAVKKAKSPKFHPDLDLFLGKLDKGMKTHDQVQKGKHNPEVMSGKKEIIDIGMKMKHEEGNIDIGKVYEGKKIELDLGQFSAGKTLQEKLDLSRLRISEEKKQFKGKLLKLYEDSFNLNNSMSLDDFDIEKAEDLVDLEKANVVNEQDGRMNVDIEELLQDGNRNLVPDNENNDENLDIELFREPGGEFIEEDSDDDILEEFLNTEKEKLANVEMKKKAVTNLVNAAHIDDAELTELLQEAYDHNIEIMKGKKVISQSPKKLKVAKKIISPPESNYCMANLCCKMCDKTFETIKALKIHFAKYHRYKFKPSKIPPKISVKMCDVCGKTFTNRKSLVQHLRNHDKPKKYQCQSCQLVFNTEHHFENHKMTHASGGTGKTVEIPNDLENKIVCQICGALSSSASNARTHERRHSRTHSLHCRQCGHGFHRRSDLDKHTRLHTGEKPFQCEQCDKRFSRRDTLNRHIKIHTDERNYQCQYCEKYFMKNYDLKRHQKDNKECLQLRGINIYEDEQEI